MNRFLTALNEFATVHNLPRDLASRVRKASEEIGEVAECAINGDIYNLEGEICDHVNTALLMLMAVTKDPAGALMANLVAKDEKYRAGEQRMESKR